MTVPIDTLTHHVGALCDKHDISLEWNKRGDAWGGLDLMTISIPPIKSPVTYGIALHEIGHILGRHQTSKVRLVRERWAWAWAKQHALIWTPGMERKMQDCLAWYERNKKKHEREDRQREGTITI